MSDPGSSGDPREILYGEYSRFQGDLGRSPGPYALSADDVSWFAAIAGEIRNDDDWKEIFVDRMSVVLHLLQIKRLVEAGEALMLLDSETELLGVISVKLLDDAPDHQKTMTWKYQAGIQLRNLSACYDQRLPA